MVKDVCFLPAIMPQHIFFEHFSGESAKWALAKLMIPVTFMIKKEEKLNLWPRSWERCGFGKPLRRFGLLVKLVARGVVKTYALLNILSALEELYVFDWAHVGGKIFPA